MAKAFHTGGMLLALLSFSFAVVSRRVPAPTFIEPGRRFYLSPIGSDTNSGLSPNQSWRSLNKLTRVALGPGDEVILQRGGAFKGNIALTVNETGTPERPIVIRSSGSPRATILSDDKPGISAAAGGIEIKDLILKGSATKRVKNYDGITFRANGQNGEKYRGIKISNVDISGFGDSGISIGSMNKTRTGFVDVKITHAHIHDNFGEGISTWDDAGDRAKGYAHKDLLISDCDVSNNGAGTGMVISGFDGGLIEYCSAFKNHGHGGVGIWAYTTRNVLFRYCIAAQTNSNAGDGGGFDLDGGCDNCVIEHCYAYENSGPGYMHCDYPTAPPTRNNVIRDSMSINDGRKAKGDAIGFGFVTWGSGLDSCMISNNTAVVTESDPKMRNEPIFFVSYLVGSQDTKDVLHVRESLFKDNIAFLGGKGVALVSNDLPNPTLRDVFFTGNWFFVQPGVSSVFKNGKLSYKGEDEWRKATGQEPKVDTLSEGKEFLASHINLGNYRLTDPHALTKMRMTSHPTSGY